MLFEIRNLTKSYAGTKVLDIESLDMQEGRIWGLVGPNGSGKTTLLEILDLLVPPTSGEVKFNGLSLFEPSSLAEVREKITFVRQNPVMFRGTVIANVEYGLRVRGEGKSERTRRASQALEEVGLAELSRRMAKSLSAGEKQRVAIARAICLRPKVLLLDEPTASVDKENVGVIHELIRGIHSDLGVSVVFTSHDIDETVKLGDEFVALDQGKPIDFPVRNIFRGKIEHVGERSFVLVAGGLRIETVTMRTGAVKISVDPSDIILSRHLFDSSARNRLRGSIQELSVEGESVRVVVDCGIQLMSIITRRSFDEMALSVGDEIFLSFKSVAVKVY